MSAAPSVDRMTLADRAAAYNRTFPQYPGTCFDKGWLYGVWYCGTSWQKAQLYGQYPGNYLRRVLSLFPDAVDILQPCAGTVREPGLTLDFSRRFRPAVIANVETMPLRDASYDLVIVDPPYSAADAKQYDAPKPSPARMLSEFRRVLRSGGYLVWLDTKYPSYRRKDWRLVGLIAVITGFLRATRCCSIWEKS